MIDHGMFRLYEPDASDDVIRVRKSIGALFLRNEDGVDWYSIAHAKPTGNMFVCLDDRGCVASFHKDPSTLWPIDFRLIETDQQDVAWGMKLDGDKLAIPPPEPPPPARTLPAGETHLD